MTKRIIILGIIFLGCSTFTYLNESKATDTGKSSSASERTSRGKHHRYNSPYKILNSRYVSRSIINRSTASSNNGVRIKILQNGMDNTGIEDFSVSYDSGNEYRVGNIFGIENSSLPLYVKVTYRSWNTFHAVQFDVTYEFMVYYPGTWNVTLWN
jgi:hypothetical protein